MIEGILEGRFAFIGNYFMVSVRAYAMTPEIPALPIFVVLPRNLSKNAVLEASF